MGKPSAENVALLALAAGLTGFAFSIGNAVGQHAGYRKGVEAALCTTMMIIAAPEITSGEAIDLCERGGE